MPAQSVVHALVFAQVKQLAWVNHNKLLLIKFSGLERVRFFYSISITFILIRILNNSLLH